MASSSSRYWAKLVSLEPSISNVILTKDCYLIGTQECNDITIKHIKFDKDFQCMLLKESENSIWIQNLLSNAIMIENKTLSGNRIQLTVGDRISFVQKSRGKMKEVPGFIFCPAQTFKPESKSKRVREDTQVRGDEALPKIDAKMKEILNSELKCSICLDYLFTCTVVIPCLHNFCAACISDWINDSDSCPQCRGRFVEIKKNLCLNNIVETYLNENPSLKRSEDDYENMIKRDEIKSSYRILLTPDGSRYKGNIVDKKMDGYGTMEYASGDVYSGKWVNGRMQGYGKLIYEDGSVYEGQWYEGVQDGVGTFYYADGALYLGSWRAGLKQGIGQLKYENGDSFLGQWLQDKRHGIGEYNKLSSSFVYEGHWVDDKMHGFGRAAFADGGEYLGEWVRDRMEGMGKYTYTDGVLYTGGWVNNLREGMGILTSADGTELTGEWRNNIYVEPPAKKKKVNTVKKVVVNKNKKKK